MFMASPNQDSEQVETPEQCLADLEAMLATVNDDMRTLLRQWACCMQKPRTKDWEKAADDLLVRTRMLLGNFSAAEHKALRACRG